MNTYCLTTTIPLDTCPAYYRRTVIEMNLTPMPSGKGNKSRRRAGLPVVDTGLSDWHHGMDRGETALMLATPAPCSITGYSMGGA